MDSLGRLNESTHLKYLAYCRESMKSSFVEMKIRGKGKTWEEDHGRMALKPNMETNLYNPLGYKWNLPHLWMLWVHAVELTPEFCYFLIPIHCIFNCCFLIQATRVKRLNWLKLSLNIKSEGGMKFTLVVLEARFL